MNKAHSNREYFEYFQSKFLGLGVETVLKYRRTLSELNVFLTEHRLLLANLSETMVADWVAELFRGGLAKNTVIRHLNILSSLAKSAEKRERLPASDAPRLLVKKLTESADVLPVLLQEKAYKESLGLLRRILKRADNRNVYEDMFLFSMLNGAIPFGEVAVLKKEDVSEFGPVSRQLLERNQSAHRNYVFDLKQSYRTRHQIYSSVTDGLKHVFGKINGISSVDPDSLVRSMWAACAIRCGATASEALGCIGTAAPYAVPSFCTPVSVSSENKHQWIRAVSQQVLLDEMPKWYVMHLRRGVKFEDLRKEIAEKVQSVPGYFYPCETIVKLSGNRKIIKEQPFISQTVFFKSRPEDVLPLFRSIGDKAWCYRINNAPTSPYAVIPQEEMNRFQAAVGIFTSDVEVFPLGEIVPRPGESVVVIMAGYTGREGRVEEVINNDSESTIFRVKLTTEQGYEWRVNVDGRQIKRALIQSCN